MSICKVRNLGDVAFIRFFESNNAERINQWVQEMGGLGFSGDSTFGTVYPNTDPFNAFYLDYLDYLCYHPGRGFFAMPYQSMNIVFTKKDSSSA